MAVSFFDRSFSLSRGLRRKPTSKQNRRVEQSRLRLAIDQLESRLALAITSPLTIGGTTVASFFDTPTGPGSLGDLVTVSIEGTKGTAIFNGGKGVADGTDIQTIEIVDASPDFQITFNGLIQTANPVPYGSDGIVQLGTITTTNVIRGINTVRGPATNVALSSPPNGFTQASAGSADVTLAGDQGAMFDVGVFVAATPLLPSTGTTVFSKVSSWVYDSGTDTTAILLGTKTGGSTTAGALTTAETRDVEFQLTKFTGVNFADVSGIGGSGLMVDTVLGDGTPEDLGIVLSRGLRANASIMIRKQLDATLAIGADPKAAVNGRMFIESATAASRIFVGPKNTPNWTNSMVQLLGGAGEFGADVAVAQPFNGVMNLGGAATGTVAFARGVGQQARLNAAAWNEVLVEGDFAGTINSTSDDVRLAVTRNVTGTARVNSDSDVSLLVGGSIQKGAVVSADSGVTFAVGSNLLGTIQAGSSTLTGTVAGNVSGATLASSDDITLVVGGSVVNSTLASDNDFSLAVRRNITNSQLQSSESNMTAIVDGSVTNSTLVVGDENDLSLAVGGNLTGSSVRVADDIRAIVVGNISRSQFISTTGDVTLNVGGDIKDSTLIAGDEGVTLTVGRDALNVKVVGDDNPHSLDIGRNFSGTVQSGSGDVTFGVGGSVLKGSSITTGGNAVVDVTGNFDGSVTSGDLRFFVDGNVSTASRIVAQRVTDWQGANTANFEIGGRLDGIVNVGVFDAAPNFAAVTVLGKGAGSTARFNVGRFETDAITFQGNFNGNLRVLQDLTASLLFSGNVNFITIGGRVGSYDTANAGAVVPALIAVTGQLKYLNSNSYFQAAVAGKSGTFYNDALGTQSTGLLTTGSYLKVVPTLQVVPAPGPTPPQTYTAPTAPQNFAASPTSGPDGIQVSFDAPSSNGGLPVVYYEYTTNGGTNWRRFNTPSQGPGTNIALTVDSNGNAFVAGAPGYSVGVRAVNAIGPTATAFLPVIIPV